MEGLKTVAELMAIAARTAPKSRGEDFIEIKIIEGEDEAEAGVNLAVRLSEAKLL